MATVNFIRYRSQSATVLGKVAEYVSQNQKTMDRESGLQFVSGINCSPQFAVQEFRVARAAHHKESPVWFYHYTQSFSPDEPVTGQQAHEVAKEFAERAWPDSQILVATHVDARHIHSHFIVNAVCHESGYMLRQGRKQLSDPTEPTHMPEYPQKTSAVDTHIYGALAGAEGLEPSARGFGVDVEKASADMQQPVFRTVEPFVFPQHTLQKILMIY